MFGLWRQLIFEYIMTYAHLFNLSDIDGTGLDFSCQCLRQSRQLQRGIYRDYMLGNVQNPNFLGKAFYCYCLC